MGPQGQIWALQRYTMEQSGVLVEKLWLSLSFHGIYSLLFIDVTVAGQHGHRRSSGSTLGQIAAGQSTSLTPGSKVRREL